MIPATERTTQLVVVAAAAPLWDSVEAAGEVAVFGGSLHSEYREWAKPLIADQDLLAGRLHTVGLCGEPVRVLDEATASFFRVELPAQPNGASGYIGFMSTAHVGPDVRRTPTHVVVGCGVYGTTVELPRCDSSSPRAASESSPPRELPSRIELPAGMTVELLFLGVGGHGTVLLASGAVVRCSLDALRPIGTALSAVELLQFATAFVGTPYLWGGTEAAGIDCSGLVHTAARMGGRVLPRDAHHQWAATRLDARWEDLHAGDLIFFGDSASLEGIDHVGIYAGESRMLHAPEAGRPVAVEALEASARRRAVGFGRY